MHTKEMSEDDPNFNEVDSALDRLKAIASEHFDSGILMFSRVSNGNTSFHSTEFGNKFAIKGMVISYTEGELNQPDLEEILEEEDED